VVCPPRSSTAIVANAMQAAGSRQPKELAPTRIHRLATDRFLLTESWRKTYLHIYVHATDSAGSTVHIPFDLCIIFISWNLRA
jgi:hypothetical protein